MRRIFLSIYLKCVRRDQRRDRIDKDLPRAEADGASRAIPTPPIEVPKEAQEMIDRAWSEAALRTGHSVGPLRAEKALRKDSGGEDWAIVDGLGMVVGIAYGRAGECGTRPAAGNAALWAAAPDMHLMLRLIVTQMHRFGDWQDGEFYYKGVPCPELRAMINGACQVLDKACGTAG